MLYMRVTIIASYVAPHAYVHSTRTIEKYTYVVQCAGSPVRFGILKMAVADRRAVYLYSRIEGDPFRTVSLAISSDYLYIYQTTAMVRNTQSTSTITV